MENITINNYKDFHDRLIGLGFKYVDSTMVRPGEMEFASYIMMVQVKTKTQFRIGLDMMFDSRNMFKFSVVKQLHDGDYIKKHIGKFEQIENEIPFDTIVEIVNKYNK